MWYFGWLEIVQATLNRAIIWIPVFEGAYFLRCPWFIAKQVCKIKRPGKKSENFSYNLGSSLFILISDRARSEHNQWTNKTLFWMQKVKGAEIKSNDHVLLQSF